MTRDVLSLKRIGSQFERDLDARKTVVHSRPRMNAGADCGMVWAVSKLSALEGGSCS